MKALASLTVLVALLGCTQPASKSDRQPDPGKKTVGFEPHPKALIAQRVEGKSPWTVAIHMEPEQPRADQPTTFDFLVTDSEGPVKGGDVRVALVMPLMDMGKNEFDTKEVLPGVYEGSGKVAMDGEWEVFVTVTRGGAKGTHVFNVRVAE
jgi:YtkA-like protein